MYKQTCKPHILLSEWIDSSKISHLDFIQLIQIKCHKSRVFCVKRKEWYEVPKSVSQQSLAPIVKQKISDFWLCFCFQGTMRRRTRKNTKYLLKLNLFLYCSILVCLWRCLCKNNAICLVKCNGLDGSLVILSSLPDEVYLHFERMSHIFLLSWVFNILHFSLIMWIQFLVSRPLNVSHIGKTTKGIDFEKSIVLHRDFCCSQKLN